MELQAILFIGSARNIIKRTLFMTPTLMYCPHASSSPSVRRHHDRQLFEQACRMFQDGQSLSQPIDLVLTMPSFVQCSQCRTAEFVCSEEKRTVRWASSR